MKQPAALALVITSALAVSTLAQTPHATLLDMVDHLVYATPDLNTGIERLETLLDVRASPGGQHPGRGTRNALISLGPRTYIEIIGPDLEQAKPDRARQFGIDDLSEPRLVTWAAKESDLAKHVDEARKHGITLGELGNGSRKRPDGLLLTWRYTDPRTVVADGIVPFFIDWGRTPHPAESAAPGGRLVSLRAEHPDADRVQTMLGQLGVALPVTRGSKPTLIATIDSSRGRVELR
jgi:Glyoxalase-like domain